MTPNATLARRNRWVGLLELLFERFLAYIAAAVMFFMMMLTLVDVVGRNLFNAPISGGFEVTELMLASVIFLGLPMVTAEKAHVDVDLLDVIIPNKMKVIQGIIVSLFNTAAFGVMTWMMWELAFATYEYEDTTAVLQIPFAGLVFLMAVTCTLTTLALLTMTLFTKGKSLFGAGGNEGF